MSVFLWLNILSSRKTLNCVPIVFSSWLLIWIPVWQVMYKCKRWVSVSTNKDSKLRHRCKWWLPLLMVFVVSYTRNLCLKGRFALSHDGRTICFSNPQITATNYYSAIITTAEKLRLVFKLISVLTSILICLKCRLLPNGMCSKKDIPTKF